MALSHSQQARQRLAGLSRCNPPDSPVVEGARRDLAAAKIADYVRRVVDEAPPLSPEQVDRLTELLRGAGA